MGEGKTETIERDISLPPSPNDGIHGITEGTYGEEDDRVPLTFHPTPFYYFCWSKEA